MIAELDLELAAYLADAGFPGCAATLLLEALEENPDTKEFPTMTSTPPPFSEALCLKCRETFTPHDFTIDELEHFETSEGVPCGGLGLPTSPIVARYHEIAAGNGALAAVAYDRHGEVLDEVVDTAHEWLVERGLRESFSDVELADELRPVVDHYRTTLRNRFLRRRLVITVPVLLDRDRSIEEESPTPVLLAAVRKAIDEVPFLECELEAGPLAEALAVRIEEPRS
jgi:hypothetical protein